MAFMRRNYVGVTVTLATANTKYSLLALINAILAAETGRDNTSQCPAMCRSLVLQAYAGIDSSGGNSNDILVGDGLLSTTRIGFILSSAGGVFNDQCTIDNVNVGDVYVQSAGTNQKLNVMVQAG